MSLPLSACGLWGNSLLNRSASQLRLVVALVVALVVTMDTTSALPTWVNRPGVQ